MRIAPFCAVLWGVGIGWGWTSEDGAPARPRPWATLSVFENLTRPEPLLLYAAPGAPFFNTPQAPSRPQPRSIVLDHPVHLGGEVPLQTRFLFLPSEEKREEDPLLRFQQRMRREYGRQEVPSEDPLARGALLVGLQEKGRQGSLTASLTTVGTEFDQDQQYGLERGTQRKSLAGQYLFRPGLSVATEYTRLDRQALAQRNASEEERWQNRVQYRPSDTSEIRVAHERTQGQEGQQAARFKETVSIAGEQKLGEKATLTLKQEREHQQSSGAAKETKETTARLQWEPSRRVDLDLEQKRRQAPRRGPETIQEFGIGYRPKAPLSVKTHYTQEDQGPRSKQKREIEVEARPGEDLKVTTGFEQERKRGERYDTYSLGIEATPGPGMKLKTGYQEEEKARGNRERTQTAELHLQPAPRLSVKGRYRAQGEQHGPEKINRDLSVIHRSAHWLTVTWAEEGEWKQGLRTQTLQRVGAESTFAEGMSLTLSQEWGEKEVGEWESQSAQAAYRPSEVLQLRGLYTLRTEASDRTTRSRQAHVEVRPGGGLHLLGSLTENPEDGPGRIRPGRQFTVQIDYQMTPDLSLSGRSARHDDERPRMWRQETEWGLSLGPDRARLSTHVRLQEALSLGRQFRLEYGVGYSRQIDSHLSWSLAGVLQRWEDRYGSVDNQQQEYRGEAKLNISF